MRFRFTGFGRESGQSFKGYVEASDADAAYAVLSERSIVTELLEGDPDSTGPLINDPQAETPDVSLFENSLEEALDSALDASSTRVSFDTLTKYYRGKKVRVIDRDKIRQQVADVVDSTLLASETLRESTSSARERVASAISGLFYDSRSLTSEPKLPAATSKPSEADLSDQIGRLSGVVQQAEGLIAAMQAALSNVQSGSASSTAPRRGASHALVRSGAFLDEQNSVLREILESNIELRRAMAKGTT